MALLVFRLGYLQLSAGETYLGFAEGNRLRDRVLLAPRGTVVDRFGEVLARNTTSFRLVVVPFDVPKSESAHLFEQAKALLKLEEEKINYKAMEKLGSTSIQPIVVYSGLSRDQASAGKNGCSIALTANNKTSKQAFTEAYALAQQIYQSIK
jgi:penicillin-binding protein 2